MCVSYFLIFENNSYAIYFRRIFVFNIHAGYKSALIKWDAKLKKTFMLTSLFHADCRVYLESFFFASSHIRTSKVFFCKNFAGHVRSRGRIKPSVNKYYGICMLFTREPPSTFVWIIPEINQCPFYHSLPLSDSSLLEQATRKADKWSQFVHFMRSYIIRETSRSHLRRAKVHPILSNLNFKFYEMLRSFREKTLVRRWKE